MKVYFSRTPGGEAVEIIFYRAPQFCGAFSLDKNDYIGRRM